MLTAEVISGNLMSVLENIRLKCIKQQEWLVKTKIQAVMLLKKRNILIVKMYRRRSEAKNVRKKINMSNKKDVF